METSLYNIHIQAEKCLRFRGAACSRCIDACPVEALSFDSTIVLSKEKCLQCGMCLHSCHTGVFSAKDEWDFLIKSVSGFLSKTSLELICGFHPEPETGISGCENAVKTANCLAALSPSLYIALQAIGMERIFLRLDACAECPAGLQKAKPAIQTIAASHAAILRLVESPLAEMVRRPVQTYKDTAISRRGLFRSLVGQGGEHPFGCQAASSERTRLLRSLEIFFQSNEKDGKSIEGLPFFEMSLTDNCNACMACARCCPSGAIKASITNKNLFKLEFAPGLCLDCKLCVAACRLDAILRTPLKTLANVEASLHRVILEDEVQTCSRCKTPFRAEEKDQTLCPACAFRRDNPFGAIGITKTKGR